MFAQQPTPEAPPHIDLFAKFETRPRLFVATPSYDGRVAYALESMILHLAAACANQGVEMTRTVLEGTSILPMARNKLTDMFLTESKCSHMLFIDSDIIVDPRDVLLMLMSKHPLVALPCSRRVLAWERLTETAAKNPEYYAENYGELLEAACVPNWEWMPGEHVVVEKNFAPVAHVGTGCMLIAREVLERLAEDAPIVKTHKSMAEDKEVRAIWDNAIDRERKLYVGEDVAFCHRARKLGYQPMILVSAKTKHVGTFEYRCNVLGELRSQITEWADPYALNDGGKEKQMSEARYEWVKAQLVGGRVAHAASGCNWAHGYMAKEGRTVVAFDRCERAKAKAEEKGYPPVTLVDIEAQSFDGFDAVVCVETLEHLRKPWLWVGGLAPSVKELLITTPMVPTKHVHSHHLHDWTDEEVVENLKKLGWSPTSVERIPDPSTGAPSYVMVRVVRE